MNNYYENLPYLIDKPQNIILQVYENLNNRSINLDDIDNRCTIEDIQQLQNKIKLHISNYRIIIIIVCLVIICAEIIFITNFPFKMDKLTKIYYIIFFSCLIIIAGLLIIRTSPMISKSFFMEINYELRSKKLIFTLPEKYEKNIRKKFGKYSFELWKIETIDNSFPMKNLKRHDKNKKIDDIKHDNQNIIINLPDPSNNNTHKPGNYCEIDQFDELNDDVMHFYNQIINSNGNNLKETIQL